MPTTLREFVKSKDYLLCVDSDGCAMDTMNVKHSRCFGPCFVRVYGITENVQAVLDRWNEINLFRITRGINRFLGFAAMLCELYPRDRDVIAFAEWARGARELSEKAVSDAYQKNGNPVFYKAYAWSRAVNQAIAALTADQKVAFEGVPQGLAAARETCDIAVVSSANYAAVAEEWERCGLFKLTDVVATQTDGSKAHCIAELLRKGYPPKNVVMCGDAEGDLLAAESNGVAFYPILVNRERESWERLPAFLSKCRAGTGAEDQRLLRRAFYENLHVEVQV